jgi:hypothetical protein
MNCELLRLFIDKLFLIKLPRLAVLKGEELCDFTLGFTYESIRYWSQIVTRSILGRTIWLGLTPSESIGGQIGLLDPASTA